MGNMLNNLQEILWKADKSDKEGPLESEIKKAEGLSDEFKELLLKTLTETDYFAKKTFLNFRDNNIKKIEGNTGKTGKEDNSSYQLKGKNNDNILKGGEAR